MKKFKELKNKINKSQFDKVDLAKNISELRGVFGGANGSSYSSTYTSGTNDCDNTSICLPCLPGK